MIFLRHRNEKAYSSYNPPEKPFVRIDYIDDNTFDLSLIIPVYNAERHIKRCIESVVSQATKYTYEMILVDDGSTDNSGKICCAFAEKYSNVTYFFQENVGVSVARNRGLKAARGRYIGFVDNDDYIDEMYVETLMKEACRIDADIVKCAYMSMRGGESTEYKSKAICLTKPIPANIIMNYNSYIWGAIYNKRIWLDFCLPEGYWYEDMCTRFILMRRAKSFSYIDKPLYVKNEHNTNASRIIWSSKQEKALDQLYLVKALLEKNDLLGMKRDITLLKVLLHEYGFVMWGRIKRLDIKLIHLAFIEACKDINCLGKELKDVNECLDKAERAFFFAFKYEKFYLWYYLSFMKFVRQKIS